MEKTYLTLDNVEVYQQSLALSNRTWSLVRGWDYFARDTVGKQFVRAVDSISANIAEGFGRYHKRDKILFYRYAYGSVQESIDWISKSRTRELISEDQSLSLLNALKQIMPALHYLIKFTNEKLTR